MELVLRDHEIAVCMDVLDFYARIFIGQYDEIDDVLSQNLCWSCGIETNRFERTLLYTAMRSLEIPELKGWELNGTVRQSRTLSTVQRRDGARWKLVAGIALLQDRKSVV